MGTLGEIGHLIMTPLYYAISAVLVAWHWLFSEVLQMDPDGGGTWVLSIRYAASRCWHMTLRYGSRLTA